MTNRERAEEIVKHAKSSKSCDVYDVLCTEFTDALDAVRDEAIEEAASICKQLALVGENPHETDACWDCERHVRSLLSKQDEGKCTCADPVVGVDCKCAVCAKQYSTEEEVKSERRQWR